MSVTSSPEAVLGVARDLAPLIKEYAGQADRERRLPPPLVEALAQANLFMLLVPRSVGGPELDPIPFLHVIEELAAADGSTGWCVVVGAEANGFLGAWLPEAAAGDLLFGRANVVSASSVTQGGRAVATGDGYRVSGRWRYASGCLHSDWLLADCTIVDGDTPRTGPDGKPLVRYMTLPRDECEIIDTWSVVGLRGTGSNDFAATDVFVPEERTLDMYREPPRVRTAAYSLPLGGLLAPSNAVVATGIARGAIDAFIALAREKTPFLSRALLRDDPRIQMQVAEAEGALQSGRAFLFGALDDACRSITAGSPVSVRQTALIHLAAVQAARKAAEAVDIVRDAAGASSIFTTSPLERAFRDVHVVTQHLALTPRLQEDAGRVLLGLEPREAFF